MADYYSILKKTVSGLPANTAENRKLVFGKARSAIDRQLRAINPPPSEEAISRQMSALEAAIEKIEAESLSASPAPSPVPPQKPFLATPPTVAPVTARPALQPQAAQRPASPFPTSPGPRPTAPSTPPLPGSQPLAGSRTAPVAPVRPASPAYDTSLDAFQDVDRPVRVRAAPNAGMRNGQEPARRTSGSLTAIVVGVVILGLLAGGGYALWRNKDPLLAALGMGASPQETTEAASDPAAVPAQDAAKEETRLGGDGTVPAPVPEGTDGEEVGTPPPATEAQPDAVPETPAQPAETAANEPQVNAVDETPQSPAVAETQPAQPAAEAPAAQTGIAQKAYLYEEGASGAGATRDEAAVVWSLEEMSPSEGLPAEPVIKGRLDVPGRGLVMDITIKRNVDQALPASHIIELLFEAPADFSGGSIDNVARFVMKSNEQARGEGLVAVPAKIDTGFFLIALNNLEQALGTNKRLLVESGWIDIPLGYTTGRRALVTLEKGAIGDKVFRDAFADWEKR